jgi:hypothetical protein
VVACAERSQDDCRFRVREPGAIWSSCRPTSAFAACRPLAQSPAVLFAVDGYRYGGKDFETATCSSTSGRDAEPARRSSCRTSIRSPTGRPPRHGHGQDFWRPAPPHRPRSHRCRSTARLGAVRLGTGPRPRAGRGGILLEPQGAHLRGPGGATGSCVTTRLDDVNFRSAACSPKRRSCSTTAIRAIPITACLGLRRAGRVTCFGVGAASRAAEADCTRQGRTSRIINVGSTGSPLARGFDCVRAAGRRHVAVRRRAAPISARRSWASPSSRVRGELSALARG